jgi:hypothetical protein
VPENPPPAPGTWGACRFCGVAVPAGASHCEICGADRPLSAAEIPGAPRAVRRRLKLAGWLRSTIVVVVIAGLTYAIVSAELAGPPVLTGDPLTTAGTYDLAPGNYTYLSGEINGGDYVLGNFTSIDPAGTEIALAVYNTSGWDVFAAHGAATPVWTLPATYDGRIIYSPLVTDTYYFVFSNPYAASTHLSIEVYITTTYESNSGDDGFA